MAEIIGPGVDSVSAPFACLGSVSVRDAVFHDASDHVTRANASSNVVAPCVGIVLFKPNPTTCVLVYKGEMSGFIGLIPTSTYYLDTVNGQITTTPPNAVGNVLQRVGWARNATTLVVEIDLDFQLL